MAKRRCEQPPVAVLPPCKKPQCEPPVHPRHCMPHTAHDCPKRKRKLEPRSTPSPECDRLTPTPVSQPPSKKQRPADSHHFKCQKDEAFQEYNSFHFWRTPLPKVDFSELVVGACDGDRKTMSIGTDVLEEMDN